jgi:hypothetical protein
VTSRSGSPPPTRARDISSVRTKFLSYQSRIFHYLLWSANDRRERRKWRRTSPISRAQWSPAGNEILEKWSAAERRFHYKSLRARGAASLARARIKIIVHAARIISAFQRADFSTCHARTLIRKSARTQSQHHAPHVCIITRARTRCTEKEKKNHVFQNSFPAAYSPVANLRHNKYQFFILKRDLIFCPS